MLSEAFTVIFALGAILAQTTSVKSGYNCGAFLEHLNANPPNGSAILKACNKLVPNKNKFHLNWAARMINDIKNLSCKRDFLQVAGFGKECRVYFHNSDFGLQIMDFVGKCAPSGHWDSRLEALKEEAEELMPLRTLNDVFSKTTLRAIRDDHRKLSPIDISESCPMSTTGLERMWDGIRNIGKKSSVKKGNLEQLVSLVIEPCSLFVEHYEQLMKEAQLTISVFYIRRDAYLKKLSQDFQDHLLLFKICKYIKDDEMFRQDAMRNARKHLVPNAREVAKVLPIKSN